MKKLSFFFNSLVILSTVLFAVPIAPAHAAIMDADAHRGASIQPFSTTDIASDSAKRAMDSLRATGANYVTLIIPYYQANRQSTDMYPSWNTPTDEALITAIDYAHSIGLKVMIKPHLETDYIEWRGNIETPAADRPKWYNSYATMLEHYGRIAQTHNVEDFCIGTEILRMASPDYNPDNTQQWKNMIARVRAVYNGKLTYSANWYGELDRIGFWDSLDYIGISAYYDLYHAQNSSVEEIKKSWDGWRSGVLQPIAEAHPGKNIIFTELGYRSIDNAHRDPWDWSRWGNYNETDQANAYKALFEYWNAYPWMKGVHLWRWDINPPAANSGNTDYTPQNKQAEAVMKQYWGGAPNPEPSPSPSPSPSPEPNPNPGTTTPPVQGTTWTTSATVIPTAPSSGGNASVTAVIKNSSSANVTGAVVDFEIYNSNGQQVFQKFFPGQNFSANQQKSFNVNWIAGPNGNYWFRIGVFNGDWTYNYYWGNEVLIIPVGGTTNPDPNPNPNPGTTTPPATETSLEIWWPGDGVTVSGEQPFKAMLTNRDVSEYTMYWQVDGDRLNEMANSTVDYPHKEQVVNLQGWNWKGTGPYNINFVAKDSSGNIIKQKGVNINIMQ